MKVNVAMPFDDASRAEEFLTGAAVVELARCAEACGFHAASVTDHPCPTARWRAAGGHDALDPFTLLGFIAAATSRLRLHTGILVLPYRNPFLTARAAATLDVLSGGRLSLGVGAGYLKGEFHALGVDFDSRNERMDEYLRALKAAWRGGPFDFEGSGYSARGCLIDPPPVQKPHPPLYIGGNSKRALRRAVEYGDGWYPFFTAGLSTAVTRTGELAGEADVAAAVAELARLSATRGRPRPPEVFLGGISGPGGSREPAALREAIERYRALGVAGVTVSFPAHTRRDWRAQAERFAAEVLADLNP